MQFRLTISLRKIVFHLIIISTVFLKGQIFGPMIVLIGLIIIFIERGRLKKHVLQYIWPLISIFIIGILGVSGHSLRHIQRDIIYSLVPIFLILAGYWVANSNIQWKYFVRSLVYWGVVLALIHLAQFIVQPNLLVNDIDKIRELTYNPGGGIIIIALTLLLFKKGERVFQYRIVRNIAIIVLFISFVLSFSRTGLLTFFFLSFSIIGILDRFSWKLVTTIFILSVGFAYLVYSTPNNETHTFRSKIARSTKEIAISDYDNMKDINSNWRGFETYRALDSYLNGTVVQLICGQGFGSLVDLGFTMELNGVGYRQIPILHNGYAYILFKTGALGLLLYIIFYLKSLSIAYHQIRVKNITKILFPRLLLGITLSLMLSMFVVGGMAAIHNSVYVFFLGNLLYHTAELNKS